MLKDHRGVGALRANQGSLVKLLISSYPEHKFYPWLFRAPSPKLFHDRSTRREYLIWLLERLNKTSMSELTIDDVRQNHGEKLAEMYNDSISSVIGSIHPSQSEIEDAKRVLIEEIGPRLGVHDARIPASWVNMRVDDFIRAGGARILSLFDFSLRKALSCVFYNSNSFSGIEDVVPNMWSNPRNLRAAIDFLLESQNATMDDIYNLRCEALFPLEDTGVLDHYNHDLLAVLQTAYPERTWDPDRFYFLPRKVPTRELIQNVRRCVIEFGTFLKIESNDFAAWYDVPYDKILSEKLWDYIHHSFSSSRFKLFAAAFPEHEWLPWRFRSVRSRSMFGPAYIKKFAQWLEKELGVREPEDWYRITRTDFETKCSIKLNKVFINHRSFISFLQKAYPEIDWKPERMAWSAGGWSHIQATLEILFPGQILNVWEYSKKVSHGEVPESLHRADSILVVPTVKLVVEYQGPSMYVSQLTESANELALVDSPTLRKWAQRTSFTPFSVPFWWNRDLGSLAASLYSVRPDLFESSAPLNRYFETATRRDPFPHQIPIKEVHLGARNLRQWLQDPRLERFFTNAAPARRKRGRPPQKRDGKTAEVQHSVSTTVSS